MIRILIVFTALAAVLGQEYFVNNLVDFQEPYQIRTLPYPYDERSKKVGHIQSKPLKNAIVVNNRFEEVKTPAFLVEKQVERTSLSSINTSMLSSVGTVVAKFLGIAKSALSHLIQNTPAMMFGAVVVVLFCKITSVCTKISGIKSLSEAQKEFSAFVTPERLDMATEFVQDAIRRYRSIQTS